MKSYITDLFEFPILVVDGMEERRKQEKKQRNKERFGDFPNQAEDEDEPLDTLQIMAEYPYTYFIGITDRWLPTDKSLAKARKGKFEACSVTFANFGTFTVPMTRQEFKDKYNAFVADFESKREIPKKQESEPVNIPIVFIKGDQIKEEQDGN